MEAFPCSVEIHKKFGSGGVWELTEITDMNQGDRGLEDNSPLPRSISLTVRMLRGIYITI